MLKVRSINFQHLSIRKPSPSWIALQNFWRSSPSHKHKKRHHLTEQSQLKELLVTVSEAILEVYVTDMLHCELYYYNMNAHFLFFYSDGYHQKLMFLQSILGLARYSNIVSYYHKNWSIIFQSGWSRIPICKHLTTL